MPTFPTLRPLVWGLIVRLLLAVAAAATADPAPPAGFAVVRPADAASAAALPPPLRLAKMPLENAARVLSARYNLPIRVDANASAMVSGDFTAMSPAEAVAQIAKQANLAATPLGPQAFAGYCIGPVAPQPAGGKRADEAKQQALVAERRAKLLAELERLSR